MGDALHAGVRPCGCERAFEYIVCVRLIAFASVKTKVLFSWNKTFLYERTGRFILLKSVWKT